MYIIRRKERYYQVFLKLKWKSTTSQDVEREDPKGRSMAENNGIALKPLTFRDKLVTRARACHKHRPRNVRPKLR